MKNINPIDLEKTEAETEGFDEEAKASAEFVDFDYINYIFRFSIPVSDKDGKRTKVEAEILYEGTLNSRMFVKILQKCSNTQEDYTAVGEAEFVFDSKLFEKTLKEYLEYHLRMLDANLVPYPLSIVIGLFNEVLDEGNLAFLSAQADS